MRFARQVIPGLLIASAFFILILGSFVLSFAEGAFTPGMGTPTDETADTQPMQAINPATDTPMVVTPTSRSITSTVVPSLTLSITTTITPAACQKPAGWIPYMVKAGDTLEKLADQYLISVEELLSGNCLNEEDFAVDLSIYIPPLPSRTAVPCGPPSGWILYPIQPGDTLYRLSVMFDVTVQQLQKANCMGTSILLLVGEWIYVPPWAPILPTSTDIPILTPAPTWTVIVPPTWTVTPSDTPMETGD